MYRAAIGHQHIIRPSSPALQGIPRPESVDWMTRADCGYVLHAVSVQLVDPLQSSRSTTLGFQREASLRTTPGLVNVSQIDRLVPEPLFLFPARVDSPGHWVNRSCHTTSTSTITVIQ